MVRQIFRILVIIAIGMGGQATYAQSKKLDVLHLKDGSEAVGKIQEEISNMGVKLIDESGYERVFLYDDIAKRERRKGVLFEEEGGLKSPEWAALYSFLIPGCGQYYTKNYSKGAIMTACWMASGAAIAASYQNIRFERADYGSSTSGANALLVGSILCFLGNTIYSMVDAYSASERYNEQIRQRRIKIQPSSMIYPSPTGAKLHWGLSLQLYL